MLKTFSAAALLALTGAAFAQTTTPAPSTAPSTSPGQPPMTNQLPEPVVAPSQTPSVGSSPAPVAPPVSVGGMSRCENMIGADRDSCLQQERAGTGATSSGSIGGTSSGTSTQPTAPIGSPSGTIR